jgi:hypothetical protein
MVNFPALGSAGMGKTQMTQIKRAPEWPSTRRRTVWSPSLSRHARRADGRADAS